MTRRLPLTRPHPAALSTLGAELAAIEESHLFSNYGPVNTRLDHAFETRMFGGVGHCVTVCNATIGLMLALRHVARRRPGSRNFAVMPSFTFAAMPHAALWAGLTPLLIDVDPLTWLPSHAAEEQALRRYGDEVAVVFPYATFGNNLDLDRYQRLSLRHGVPIVVDAAASLGSVMDDGRAFGTGFPHPIVFSMHVTKSFATGEAGLIYSGDASTIATLRTMGNYGFGEPRTATMAGLNSKLSEVGALLGLAKLEGYDEVVRHRTALGARYRAGLPGWQFQSMRGQVNAIQFMPVLLPDAAAAERSSIIAALGAQGIGAGAYFHPHVARQPYFAHNSVAEDLSATDALTDRILSLPMADDMTVADVDRICAALRELCGAVTAPATGFLARSA